MKPEDKLKEIGLELPPEGKPGGNYVKAVRTGDLLFLAGTGSVAPDGSLITGKLGQDLSLEQGYEAARRCGVGLISTLKNQLGELERVKQIVKVLGMVNSAPEFTDHPKVINGCSDLLVEVFGDKGKHARSAVGMGSLPSGLAVEIEMIVEVE